jgi:antitoxin MazE
VITKIIPIGNSKGIRIPNQVLKQLNIEAKIELVIDENNNEIRLKPIHQVREGWDFSFKKMRTNNDDNLIIDDSIDIDDWEW